MQSCLIPPVGVKPSFGTLRVVNNNNGEVRQALGNENYDSFVKAVEPLENVDVVIDGKEIKVGVTGRKHMRKVNVASPVIRYYGPYVVGFDGDAFYIPENRMTKIDFEKYGKNPLQKAVAAVEYVARELNNPNNTGKVARIFGRFS